MRKIISMVAVTLIVGILLIGCGNEKVQPVVEEPVEDVLTEEEIETLYEIPMTTVGQIEIPTKDIANERDPILTFERSAEISKGYVGKELTPQMMYDLFMIGYEVVTDPSTNTHEYYFYDTASESRDWIRVKFNEDDSMVEEVETSLDY